MSWFRLACMLERVNQRGVDDPSRYVDRPLGRLALCIAALADRYHSRAANC